MILETDDTAVLLEHGVRPDALQSIIAQTEALGQASQDEPADDWDDGTSALVPQSHLKDTAL